MNFKTLILVSCLLGLFSHQKSYAQCENAVGDTVYVTNSFGLFESLRMAINCVNDPGNSIRFIHFNIDDPDVITIQPTSLFNLPDITKDNVVIDARTQPGWYLGKVVIDGNMAGNVDGLRIFGDNTSVYGLTIRGYTNTNRGGLYWVGDGALLEQNALNGNQYGIQVLTAGSGEMRNNIIGVDPVTDLADGNATAGVNIVSTSLMGFTIENNVLAHNPVGVSAVPPVPVLIRENSMYCNTTIGIERGSFSVAGFALNDATTTAISGTGPNGALIEVFINDNSGCSTGGACQGRTSLGTTTVSGGSWTLNITPGTVMVDDEITATATVNGNNTSEFLSCLVAGCPSANIVFSAVQNACGDTPTGTVTASVSIAGSFTYEWSDGQMNAEAIDLLPDPYSVTATDVAGCTYVGSITIDELPSPTINPFGSTPLCVGETLLLEANASGGTPSYLYSWEGPEGFTSNEADPSLPNIQIVEGGTYSLTVTDANGCEERENTVVVVNEAPTFNLNVTDVSCNGAADGSINLVPTVIVPSITYAWSTTANTEDIDNLGPGSYSVTVTDGNGCVATGSATVMESPVLVVDNLQTTTPSMIGGNDGTLMFNINGGNPPYAYTWTGPVNGNANQANAGTATITSLLAGNYNLMVTDDDGCTVSLPFTINGVDCSLMITGQSITDESCAGATDGSVSLTLSNGSPPYSYNWTAGALNGNGTGSIISNLVAATYAITITDGNGCVATGSATVMEPPALVVDNLQATTPSTIGGNDGTLMFDISGGNPPYAYTWTGPVNGNANQANAGTAMISSLLAGNYNLMVTDDGGCTVSLPFTINSVDCNLMITGQSIIDESCAGAMDGSVSLTLSNGLPPYSYNWTAGPLNGNGAGSTISNLVAATYAITITDQDNCTATFIAVVNTANLPAPTSTSASNCDEGGSSAIFDLTILESTINPDMNLSILWFEDAAGTMPIGNPSSYASSGELVYAATSQGGCQSALVSSQLIVLPESDPACASTGCTSFAGTFSSAGPQMVCTAFSAVDIYNNDAVLDEDDALIFILHTLPGENLGTILAVEATPVAAFDPSEMDYDVTYYLTAVVGNSGGVNGVDLTDPCLSVATGQAVVFTEMLGGVLNFIQGDEELCQGEDLLLSTNVLSGFDLAYYWILPSGDTIVSTTANVLIENIQPLDAGDYYVFVQDADCLFDQTGPFTLAVLGLPPGEHVDAGSDTVICDDQFILSASPISAGSGSWTGPVGVNISDPNASSTSVSGLTAGANQFIWSVNTPECGTIGTDTVTVVVAAGLQAADDFFTLAQANDEIFMDVLKNDGIAEGTSYTLTALTQPEFGTLLTLDHGFQYFETEGFRGTVTFVYEVCYTDGNCASSCATATVTIEVLNLPYLPEGFTPNNDGKNDQLEVLGYLGGGDLSMKIKITNRWGDIVYAADDYLIAPPWDGRLNNQSEPLPEGTYYAWLEITVDGEIYQQSQAIYLIH